MEIDRVVRRLTVERKVICPACKNAVAGVVEIERRLYAAEGGAEVIGYKCNNCGKVVHCRLHPPKEKSKRQVG